MLWVDRSIKSMNMRCGHVDLILSKKMYLFVGMKLIRFIFIRKTSCWLRIVCRIKKGYVIWFGLESISFILVDLMELCVLMTLGNSRNMFLSITMEEQFGELFLIIKVKRWYFAIHHRKNFKLLIEVASSYGIQVIDMDLWHMLLIG